MLSSLDIVLNNLGNPFACVCDAGEKSNGVKNPVLRREKILKPECRIGIHRRRTRERCFEIRTLTGGSFSLVKTWELTRTVQRD